MARRPKREQVDFDEWLLNVHDVFMNAQLLRVLCDDEPVEHDFLDPGVFMTSRRGRLERGAMRDLYVLVEAFRASPPEYLDEMRRLAPEPYRVVESLLEDVDRLNALRAVRDYMSHRDLRRYMDEGRIAVATVGPSWHRALESAFDEVILGAMRAGRVQRQAGGQNGGVAGTST